MNEENNNYEVEFENNENIFSGNSNTEEVVVPGNIIGFGDDENLSNEDYSKDEEQIQGPIIMSNTDDNVEEDNEEISGPIIVNSDENEVDNVENYKDENPNVSFKEIEKEIASLKEEKEEIVKNIEELTKRNNELDILIKNKQEELDYKKEVEVTTDKLKTYIRDLEVKPGAVRDALAALINNMDK